MRRHTLLSIVMGWAVVPPLVLLADRVQDQRLYVGILEFPNSQSDTLPRVRLAFVKEGNDWSPIRGPLPSNLRWTVTFDGRNLGSVQSRTPAVPRAYNSTGKQLATYGLHEVTTASRQVPRVGQPSRDFMLETDYSPVYRPLIIVSEPNYEDPQRWKPHSPTREELRLAIAAFRERVKVHRCDERDRTKKSPNEYRYPDDAIRLIRAYRSSTGQLLIHIQLDWERWNCQHDLGIDEEWPLWSGHWFYVDPRAQVHFAARDLTRVIDAGDYDRDGRSEFVVRGIGGGDLNEDGYTILYGDFSRSAVRRWIYH